MAILIHAEKHINHSCTHILAGTGAYAGSTRGN